MKEDTTILPFRQSEKVDDPLTEIAREGARRMLAEAVGAEADGGGARCRERVARAVPIAPVAMTACSRSRPMLITRLSCANSSMRPARYGLAAVAGVERTAMVPVRVCSASVFTMGTTPTNGSWGKVSRSWSMACTVAVLQAITISFTSRPSRKRTLRVVRSRISSGDFSPMGAWPASAK